MTVYRVSVREVLTQDYLAIAETSDEAKDKVFRRQADIDESTLEYSHDLDSSTWTTEEVPLQKGDVVNVGDPDEGDLHNHAFIGRIVSIVKNDEEEYCSVVDQEDNVFNVVLDNVSRSRDDIDLSDYLS